MGVSGHVISCFDIGREKASFTSLPVVEPTSLAFRHPPGPWATPWWNFPSLGWLSQVTYNIIALGSYNSNDQVLCNSSMDYFSWSNVKEVGIVGYQRRLEIMTGRATGSAQLTVVGQLTESPDAVVALEC